MSVFFRLTIAVAVCVFAFALRAEQRLAIFHAHVHYNRVNWNQYSPAAVMALWDENGVTAALVSSTRSRIALGDRATRRLNPA